MANPPSPLAAPTPHTLQQPVPLRQPVQTVVALAHRAHEATHRVHLVLARVSPALIHLADGDLHAGVVFGFDDAVGRGAFAGDVAVDGGLAFESVAGNEHVAWIMEEETSCRV